jgi:hypothetical protein
MKRIDECGCGCGGAKGGCQDSHEGSMAKHDAMECAEDARAIADMIQDTDNLPEWLEKLTNNFQQAHQEDANLYQPLNILLPPQQQMIGDHVYEVTFIADTDGLPLEFIRRLT